MHTKKFRELNYFIVFFIIIFLAAVNYIDIYNFLSQINVIPDSVSMQDIVIYTIYGISCDGRSTLIDIFRFSLPYMLVMMFAGVYLQDILEDNKRYLQIIRYKSYHLWIIKNIIKLNIFVLYFFTIYYCALVIISLIFTNNIKGFTKAFYILNPSYSNSISFIELLMFQFFLSAAFSFLFIMLQFLFILFTKDSHKSFVITSLSILIFSFLGKFNLYNPLMLCKHSLIGTASGIHPLMTVSIDIICSIIIYLLIIKSLKIIIRRDGI